MAVRLDPSGSRSDGVGSGARDAGIAARDEPLRRSRSTRSGACRWTRCSAPTRAIRVRRWRWRRSAYTIFTDFLRADPRRPAVARPRPLRALSAGHASMLLYSLLHLTGYDLEPRGPQAVPPVGLAHARPSGARPHARGRGRRPARSGRASRTRVGMAMAERFLRGALQPARSRDRRPPRLRDLLRRRPDGGRSPGGGLDRRPLRRSGKLVVCYDDNHITIDGTTAISFDGEDHLARFAAYGWHVQRVADANDLDALEAAHRARARGNGAAVAHRDPLAHRLRLRTRSTPPRPTAHALGEEEVRATKEALGWDPDASSSWPTRRLRAHEPASSAAPRRARVARALRGLARPIPELAAEWDRAWAGELERRLARGAAELRRPAKRSRRARPGSR